MRNTRNPRYAPEFLERKLSPSAYVGGLTAAAAVSTMTPSPNTTNFNADPTDPPPPPPDPIFPF